MDIELYTIESGVNRALKGTFLMLCSPGFNNCRQEVEIRDYVIRSDLQEISGNP